MLFSVNQMYHSLVLKTPSRKATDEELNLVHTESYIDNVKGYRSSAPIVCEIEEFYPTYVCDDTYEAAAVAVGGCLNLVDAVMTNQVGVCVRCKKVKSESHQSHVLQLTYAQCFTTNYINRL